MSEAPPNPSAPSSPTLDSRPTFSQTDLALFEAFLRHGLSRDHLAAATNSPHLSTIDIIAWLNLPHIAAALAQARHFSATAASLRLSRARFDAIDALCRVTTDPRDPTQQRLAATTLLRATQTRALQNNAHAPTPRPHTARPDAPAPTALQARGPDGRTRAWSEPRLRTGETPGHAESTHSEEVLGPALATHAYEPESPLTSSAHPAFFPDPPPIHALTDDQLDDPDDAELDDLDDAELDELDDDIEDELDHDGYTEEKGELALQFFESLKVPLTHPDIIDAIAQGRGHELQSIAARIRAQSPALPP